MPNLGAILTPSLKSRGVISSRTRDLPRDTGLLVAVSQNCPMRSEKRRNALITSSCRIPLIRVCNWRGCAETRACGPSASRAILGLWPGVTRTTSGFGFGLGVMPISMPGFPSEVVGPPILNANANRQSAIAGTVLLLVTSSQANDFGNLGHRVPWVPWNRRRFAIRGVDVSGGRDLEFGAVGGLFWEGGE
jgi:hypothetical protein